MNRFLGHFLLLAAGVTAAAPLQASRLLGVTLDPGAAATALQLSLSARIVPRVFTLKNPDRLVVDLPHTRRGRALRWPGPAGAVEHIRSALRPDGTLRAVFDLAPGTRYTLRARQGGSSYRLQFMLAAAGRPRAASANETAALVQRRHAAAGIVGRSTMVAGASTHAASHRAGDETVADAGASAMGDTAAGVPATTAADVVSAPGGAGAAGAASGVDAGTVAYSSRALPRAVRAAHEPIGGRRDIIVAVDAGHGGQDPGATGADGTHEKDVTLAIAKALAARIDAVPGMHAVLTRDGDYFITLRERIRRAHAAHADMFVSIHADSVRDRDISGASVYILSERGATNEAARLLADEENDADLKGGVSLANEGKLASVLLDLSQSASIGASVEAADSVLTALDHVGAVRKHQVLQAGFVVLKSPDIPSMLVETAYISNPAEERKLRTPGQQQRLAGAIFSGVQQYFRHHPPDGTLYASERGPVDGSQALPTGAGAAPGGFGDAAILARSRD